MLISCMQEDIIKTDIVGKFHCAQAMLKGLVICSQQLYATFRDSSNLWQSGAISS